MVRYTIVKGLQTILTEDTTKTSSHQINKWTCHKLESFSDFLNSYSRVTRKTVYCYLELFARYGTLPCQGLDCQLEGTPFRAIKSRSKFTCFSFLTPNKKVSDELKSNLGDKILTHNTQILHGNPNNDNALRKALDIIPRSASSLVFIDPEGYKHLNWTTLEKIVVHGKNWQGEKMELLIIFPLEMALLRNLMRPECERSVTRFYGNQQWEEIKRLKKVCKTDNLEMKRKLVELYKNGLRGLGYRYVDDFKPASPTHDPYYHLIFAGDNTSRLRNLKEAWGKPRFLRCELLYGIKEKTKVK